MSTLIADELARERPRLNRALALLQHRFADEALLLCALTHRSLLNERASAVSHNEVLELLGDAVLSLVAVEGLVRASPAAHEGELTERRAAWVSEEALAARADDRGLADLLRTGRSIGGSVPVSARADLVEALLGAVYLDAGLEAARAAALQLLGTPPAALEPAATHAKRVLQERLQRLFGETPSYVVERADGPHHAPTFRARATFRGVTLGEGRGKNKRTATEAAAAHALSSLDDDDNAVRARISRGPA
jgi:ribonuclease-3